MYDLGLAGKGPGKASGKGLNFVFDGSVYKPTALPSGKYPVVFIFADNTSGQKLFFAMKDGQGKQHVFNEVPAHGRARQQAFGNEEWYFVDSSHKVSTLHKPFMVKMANQWVRI